MSLILKVTINNVFRKTPKLTPPCTAEQTGRQGSTDQ